MTSFTKTKLAVVFLAAVLLASVRSANAQTITIQSAAANSTQTTLSISGANYCASPAVTLGGAALTVLTAAPASITASLPPLAPGTYYLVVSCGTLAGRTAYFDVTVGPQAPTASGGCWVYGQRYTDCGNGTVTDSITGLIWLKDAACASLGVPNYATANTAAGGLHSGQCGLSDGSVAGQWRLPTRQEWLDTLAGPQHLIAQFSSGACAGPVLRANDGVTCYSAAAPGSAPSQHAFLNVVSGGYWSSSTFELDPTYAYLADLSVANVSNDSNTVPHFVSNSLNLNVWPVRSGTK